MRTEVVALLLVAILIVGTGAGYLLGASNERTVTSTSTSVVMSTSLGTTTTTTTASASTTQTVVQTVQRGIVSLLNVSGTYYWADDVSKDTMIGMPGYSYFLNGSVTFDGVKFRTICPASYGGCPGSNSNSKTVTIGAISFNMTFPDGTTETAGKVIGDSIFTLIISQHQPRAGMYIEYVNDYGNFSNSVDYAVFLLVSSCGGSPHVC